MVLLVAAGSLVTAQAGSVEEALAVAAPHRSARILGQLPTIPADAYARAEAGEVVTGVVDTGGPLKRVWGVGVLGVSPDALAAAISDDARKPQFTSLSYAEVVEGAPCSSGRIVFQYLDVSLLSDRWWVVEQRANTAIATQSGGKVRELRWKTVPGGETKLTPSAQEWAKKGVQVTETEGAWFLVDLGDGRTLVEYVASSDPGGMVPAGLAASFSSSSVPETLAAMEKMAKAPGACH